MQQPMQTFQPKGSNRNPMTNAERQQLWRDRHRGRKRKMVALGPPVPPACVASLPGPHAAAQVVAGGAGGAIVRLSDDPAAGKVIEMYGTCVRRLTPAQRLQLARLIFDGLAAAHGQSAAVR